jgi:hypothetical protein
MTYALREARSLPARALAAPIAPVIALMTPAALGLSGDPVHEPVHVRDPASPASCYCAQTLLMTWIRARKRTECQGRRLICMPLRTQSG